MSIYFKKVREVKSPQRAHVHDAGVDFYMPKLTPDLVELIQKKNPHNSGLICYPIEDAHLSDEEKRFFLRLRPGSRALIPSGIHVAILEDESAFIAFNKSGLAANKGIVVTAQVVDKDYTGEMHLGIHNCSDSYVEFYPDDKVAQFIHVPIILSDMKEVDEETYAMLTEASDRKDGGFGSTDKQ